LADRHSQYDLWRPNPVADAQVFRGRSFVYVGEPIPGADEVFDRVEPPVRVVHAEDGVPVAAWKIWVGYGFRGFGHPRWGAARARGPGPGAAGGGDEPRAGRRRSGWMRARRVPGGGGGIVAWPIAVGIGAVGGRGGVFDAPVPHQAGASKTPPRPPVRGVGG